MITEEKREFLNKMFMDSIHKAMAQDITSYQFICSQLMYIIALLMETKRPLDECKNIYFTAWAAAMEYEGKQ